uniref:radial spoke head protein 3 homolog n=1 Tax=Solea senegalensis TaxID=28829 RepID=UPI001CD8F897|nr:radial spoke head protein 3 homolog [Solea senegalensis]
MYNCCIVSTNTGAVQHILPATGQPIPAEIHKQREMRRRGRKRARNRLKTPRKKDIEVQTHPYFEKWDDVKVAPGTECQTDTLPDIPAIVIPAKTGNDVAIQLEEKDLIDFEIDVKPVVEILVGKTIELSVMEVMEEEELACVREQQGALLDLLSNEQAEAQRLQEQEGRRREEQERRMAQQSDVLKKEGETAEKIAARAYTLQYLADLVPAAFISLRNDGYFYDTVERDIEINFLPHLMAEVYNNLEKRNTARQVLDTIIHSVAQMRSRLN